jgi:hypothetical protein
MSRLVRYPLALSLLFAGLVLSAPPEASATCYGTWTDYFETSACVNVVGTVVSCPGYPDQHDTGPDGNFTTTPWSITETVACPCPPSGGGSNGGGETGESGG